MKDLAMRCGELAFGYMKNPAYIKLLESNEDKLEKNEAATFIIGTVDKEVEKRFIDDGKYSLCSQEKGLLHFVFKDVEKYAEFLNQLHDYARELLNNYTIKNKIKFKVLGDEYENMIIDLRKQLETRLIEMFEWDRQNIKDFKYINEHFFFETESDAELFEKLTMKFRPMRRSKHVSMRIKDSEFENFVKEIYKIADSVTKTQVRVAEMGLDMYDQLKKQLKITPGKENSYGLRDKEQFQRAVYKLYDGKEAKVKFKFDNELLSLFFVELIQYDKALITDDGVEVYFRVTEELEYYISRLEDCFAYCRDAIDKNNKEA